MKSVKRVVSTVVILCMLLSSVSVFAEYVNPYDKDRPTYDYMDSVFKYDMDGFEIVRDTAKVENGQDTALLLKLGIWDDVSKNDNELVKMTDFSVIMSRFRLGAGNALEEVYRKNPDESFATNKDALKYLIEALGYYYKCREFNYSDESLLIVASQLRLISSATKINNIGANITRGELAELIVNALTIDLCETTQNDSGFTPSVKPGRNFLNTVHSTYEMSGYVNAIHGIAIFGNGDVRKGHMEIDGYDLLCGQYNGADYYGKRVKAYFKRDDVSGLCTVIYITEEEGNTLYEIDFNSISYMDSKTIEYTDENGEEQELDLSDIKNVSLNGESVPAISDIGDVTELDGKIILSSSLEGGNLDCAVVWKYNYYVVGYNSKTQNRIGLGFGFEDENGLPYFTIDPNKVNDVVIDGATATWEDIAADMIIRVAKSASGKYTQIHAKTKLLAAEVSTTDLNTAYIENVPYTLSKDLISHIQRSKTDPDIIDSHKIPEITAGLTGNFYVYDNVLVAFKTGSDFKYAFLKSVHLGKSTIDPSISLRMYTQDETWVTLDVANKLTLDGVYMTRENALEILKADSSVVKNIVRYLANSDNVVIQLDTVRTTYQEQTSTESTLTEVEGNPYEITYDWTYSYLGNDVKYRFDANTIIFQLPSNFDKENEYKILTNQIVPSASTNNKHSMNFYSPSDFNIVKVATWISDSVSAGGNIDKYMHVERITKILADAENFEYAYKVYGTEYKQLGNRGLGECRDGTFLVSEKLLEYYGIKVGMFLGIAVSGETLTSAKVFAEDGEVPAVDYYEEWPNAGNNLLIIAGTVIRVDPVDHYILIEYTIDGVTTEYLTCPRAMGIIDTQKDVTIPAKIDDFAKDDRVMIMSNVGHGQWVFKNLK